MHLRNLRINILLFMSEFTSILAAVLPIFLIVGIGALVRKLNWLTEKSDQSLTLITINVLYPCLIFESVSQNQALRQMEILFSALLLGATASVFGYFLSLGFSPLSGLREAFQRRTFAYSCCFGNYGYMGILVVASLFGKETLGVFMVFNLGTEIMFWIFAPTISRHARNIEWRKIINAPLITIALGLLFNFAGLTQWIPSFVNSTLHSLGLSFIPIAVLLIGSVGIDLFAQSRLIFVPRTVISSLAVRSLLLPLSFIAAAALLPISKEIQAAFLVHAAMPAAMFPIILARHYEGDDRTALTITLFTTLSGLITIPLWLQIGMTILNIT